MRRRDFLAVFAGAAAWPLPLRAQQQTGKVPRIGFLMMRAPEAPETRATIENFRRGLRDLGYVEGRDIILDFRSADGRIDALPGLADEFARLNVDVIVAPNAPAARAAQKATSTIPIVSTAMMNPVADGLVASLARPGGNVTGLTFLGAELVAKRLDLLKQAIPNLTRLGILSNLGAYSERTAGEMLKDTEAAARALGIEIRNVEVATADQFANAFSTLAGERVEAVLLLPSPLFFNERARMVELAAEHRLPASFNAREFVELGGLMAYGANVGDLQRRGTVYVDKILKGAKPADLAVEQPTRFELLINLKTARSLGLTISPWLLAQADEVID